MYPYKGFWAEVRGWYGGGELWTPVVISILPIILPSSYTRGSGSPSDCPRILSGCALLFLSAGPGKNLCIPIRVSGLRFEVGPEAESCGPLL